MAEDSVMAEPVELLATRRSRRSTAGNRMEAALAEMALEATADANDDDVDFQIVNDEQDEFGSDFESTDEETAQDGTEEAEKAITEEERRARKTAHSKLEKATAVAHAKHAATFNPQVHEPTPTVKDKTNKRTVSLGPIVNAETGEVLHHPSAKKKRYSQRTSTVASTSATVARAKLSEEQKASAPKKTKATTRTYTQAELIARALDEEEGNIVDHRDYLKIEEEKRKRARVTRSTIEGPLVRWVSRAEKEKRVITPPPPPPPPPQPTSPPAYAAYSSPYAAYYYRYSLAGSSSTSTYPYAYAPAGGSPAVSSPYPYPPIPSASATTSNPASQAVTNTTQTVAEPTTSAVPAPKVSTPGGENQPATGPDAQAQRTSADVPPAAGSQAHLHGTSASSTPDAPVTTPTPSYMMFSFSAKQNGASPSNPSAVTSPPNSSTPIPAAYQAYYSQYAQPAPWAAWASSPASVPATQPTAPPPEPEVRIETVTKNYVVHEAGQYDGVPKPAWKDTMSAVFGDHVKWDELRVFATSKARPMTRPTQMCPITGKEAKYLDPRSNVPFADVEAFKTLSEVLKHEYVWDPSLKRYVGQEEPPS